MVNIRISPKAFMKMQTLVMGYDKEVGWYGTAKNIGENEYRIEDILIFPQYTSSCFIDDENGDPLESTRWLESLSDDEYNNRRFHGHSHVNMTVSPSGTDNAFFKRFSDSNSAVGSFTIDLIINKSMQMHWWVMTEDGTEYKNKDINVMLEIEEGVTNIEYYESTKAYVKDLVPSTKFIFGVKSGYYSTKTSYSGASYVKTKEDREKEKANPAKNVKPTPLPTKETADDFDDFEISQDVWDAICDEYGVITSDGYGYDAYYPETCIRYIISLEKASIGVRRATVDEIEEIDSNPTAYEALCIMDNDYNEYYLEYVKEEDIDMLSSAGLIFDYLCECTDRYIPTFKFVDKDTLENIEWKSTTELASLLNQLPDDSVVVRQGKNYSELVLKM